MNALLVAMLLGLSGNSPDDCTVLPRPVMRLRLSFSADAPRVDTAVVRHVVDNVWRPYGLTFEWIDDDAPSSVGWDAKLVVQSGLPVTATGGDLGITEFVGNVPRRVIRLSSDAIVQWIARSEFERPGVRPPFESFKLRARAPRGWLPRVIGYVVAHELGHFVMASREHARRGLMQSQFLRLEHVGETRNLQLDRGSAARLRERLTQGAACRSSLDEGGAKR